MFDYPNGLNPNTSHFLIRGVNTYLANNDLYM